ALCPDLIVSAPRTNPDNKRPHTEQARNLWYLYSPLFVIARIRARLQACRKGLRARLQACRKGLLKRPGFSRGLRNSTALTEAYDPIEDAATHCTNLPEKPASAARAWG